MPIRTEGTEEVATGPGDPGATAVATVPVATRPAETTAVSPRRLRRRRSRARRSSLARIALALVGAGLIAAGVLVIAIPLYSVWQRGRADTRALDDWAHGGSQAVAGPLRSSPATVPTANPSSGACVARSAPADDYALVAFPSLPQYGYEQVAGNGHWDLLDQRSMVHYSDSSAPGAQGNSIIAFHRENEFQHIDELKDGDVVTVQDRSCHLWQYRIAEHHTVTPDGAQPFLTSTSGHELTLVTCTPWYVDTQRIVWRAELVQ